MTHSFARVRSEVLSNRGVAGEKVGGVLASQVVVSDRSSDHSVWNVPGRSTRWYVCAPK